ncbi:hypothetical protein Tco_0678355 [Tanacetum coccineum]|uniref:Tf2-1-like SH3-like domain-containing protein n=1 Tax=Tanacetum coccineum TaxID=301880 RepID=A0ABQ4XEU8_9ASTR
MIDKGVAAALATRNANKSTNGEDSHNSGTGVRRTERVARECTYQYFMKCHPSFSRHLKDVVKFNPVVWKRMETVFRIAIGIVENQIQVFTCYNQRFQELALLCVRMFSEESDKIEKYVGAKKLEEKLDIQQPKLNNQSPKRLICGSSLRAGTGERKAYVGTLSIVQQSASLTPQMGHVLDQGHYRSDCPELKNQRTMETPAEGTSASGLVHALGRWSMTDQDLNDMEDDIMSCFKAMEKVGSVAYKLEFPQELSKVHNTFHISNLKKCYSDKPLAVLLDGLHFDDKLQFVEEPVRITGS